MLRRIAVVLALAAVVPACDTDDAGDQEITITNNTGVAVFVDIEVENSWSSSDADDDSALLQTGQVYNEDFEGADEVEVRVTRVSDGTLVFHAKYDVDDFDDEDGEIHITLNP
jgi:hypothetical protein